MNTSSQNKAGNPSLEDVLQSALPNFDSELATTIYRLEEIRYRSMLKSDIHPHLFRQLQEAFHILETIESARIEGNRTTLAEVTDHAITQGLNAPAPTEGLKEIVNLYGALSFIEKTVNEKTVIDNTFIHNLHQLVVKELTREGDTTPGQYRVGQVIITGADHRPPNAAIIPALMDELVDFMSQDIRARPQYGLIIAAITHHRFTWIHPYKNGNGRVARLLTYSQLLQQGFKVRHILNPTAIFCSNRDAYVDNLSEADKGTKSGIQKWCEYMLSNLLIEIEKIDRLLELDYLLQKIIDPAIEEAVKHHTLTPQESQIMRMAFRVQEFKPKDVKRVIPGLPSHSVSRLLKPLKEKKLIIAKEKGGRIYLPAIDETPLLHGIFRALRKEGINPIENLNT